jgi:hypothetical protein
VTQLKSFPHDDGTITDVSTDGEAMKYTPGISKKFFAFSTENHKPERRRNKTENVSTLIFTARFFPYTVHASV